MLLPPGGSTEPSAKARLEPRVDKSTARHYNERIRVDVTVALSLGAIGMEPNSNLLRACLMIDSS